MNKCYIFRLTYFTVIILKLLSLIFKQNLDCALLNGVATLDERVGKHVKIQFHNFFLKVTNEKTYISALVLSNKESPHDELG